MIKFYTTKVVVNLQGDMDTRIRSYGKGEGRSESKIRMGRGVRERGNCHTRKELSEVRWRTPYENRDWNQNANNT